MRKITIATLCFVFVLRVAIAGTPGKVFLPDILPPGTLACLVPAESGARERDYHGSWIQHLSELPDMGPFLASFDESRRNMAADIMKNADISPELADQIMKGKLGFALLNIGLARNGGVEAEWLVSLSLDSQPDRATVFGAVMALLNRPEVVRKILESQGLDAKTPLKTLAQEETLAGYPPILRIGPNIRVAAIGNLIMLYHGPTSEGIAKIFNAAADPSQSLTRSAPFQATYRGAGASPGMSFTYLNAPRLLSMLDLLNLGSASRIIESLGLDSATAIGLAGGYRNNGMRHNLYVHAPDGFRSGLLSAIAPMPESPYGMEAFSNIIPGTAESFTSARIDVDALLRELPYFLQAIGGATGPDGGVSSLAANEQVLGVPVGDLLRSLGSDIVVRPHDGAQVLQFSNVDIPTFETLIARMEQNAGERFSTLNIGGYIVRYYNRRASLLAPVAPSYCLMPHQPGGNRGMMLMASHPQAVVSVIREAASARETLSMTPNYQKAISGMDTNYSLFYYNSSIDSFHRFYNFLLPLAAVWSSSLKYPVDTGLLPLAASVTPAMFGSALGIKRHQDGLVLHAYSPVGFNGILINIADKLVLSNPLVLGYAYTLLDKWAATMPGWF